MSDADHRLRVGCPMWANRSWVGRYLPSTARAGDELAAYSRELGAVEGNTTFYALPTPATVERWAEQAAPDFRFCFKLPRTITHDRRLRYTESEVAEFIERFAPLHHLMGPICVQLPASFGPDDTERLFFLGQGLVRQQENWESAPPGYVIRGDLDRMNPAGPAKASSRVPNERSTDSRLESIEAELRALREELARLNARGSTRQ